MGGYGGGGYGGASHGGGGGGLADLVGFGGAGPSHGAPSHGAGNTGLLGDIFGGLSTTTAYAVPKQV